MIIYYLIIAILLATTLFLVWRLYQQRKSSQSDDLEIERTINYFATSLFGKNTIEEILWDVTKNCISHLNFEDCVIYLVDEERKILVQKAAYGPKNPKDYEIFEPIEIPLGKGIVGSVAVSGIPEIIANTTTDPRYIVDDDLRYSEITVPIIYQGKVLGIIDAEHHEANFFQSKHLFILNTIASLCANKIMRYQVEEAYRATTIRLHENNRKIAENRLSVLRLQMNPHFVFNSLNSIGNFILKNEPMKASTYLTKFSKLVRLIFDSAQSEWVSLEQEIKSLELYIELEQLRFNNKFDVIIHVSDDINRGTLMVPPLLLQPFVENAIWHGLMPKEGERGELYLHYWLNKDRLCMSIEDNGIGRAAAIQSRSGRISTLQKHGLKLTDERIQIINEIYHAHVHAEIKDLSDDLGQPAGTRVILSMAIKQ
ncbi:histidine kinase [Paraflavitalea sp. CAU 1676]|uniref:histidine kinase n=1 Tax=Paraflavitalea sp. CAU 1676 TaxID=3032598 RepID=UPI0023DC40B6|nr:histidine kinase [Paraflavitalea sp. CAU 1676]MDF2190855.1 histidine kinase [Paraflavitalea sp. CAU 1676]